jgi:hypothetical protein
LDQAYAEFANDPAFDGRIPTREQVARAFALAIFNQADQSKTPPHSELVAALKKLFREFRDFKPVLSRSRANK